MIFEGPRDYLRKNTLSLVSIKPNKESKKENSFEKNDFIIKEKLLSDYPMPISLKQNGKIIKQLKNSVCNIYLGKGRGTGFFMKIKSPDNKHLFPALITCSHVIDNSFFSEKEEINIEINGKNKTIEFKDRIKYTNTNLDITIIEIKEKDEIKHFLQLDEENQDIRISGKTIYLLQYFDSNGPSHPSVPSVSYGILKETLKNFSFTHCGITTFGSSGSPILNLANNKVIGIHIGSKTNANYNIGKFLNIPINDFIIKMYNNKFEQNGIKSIMNQTVKKVLVEYIGTSNNKDFENIVKEKKFDENKILNYTNNNLSNINFLENKRFENLENLYLDNNKISDINILEKVRFKGLKELFLNDNNITNIEILEKVNFPNLEVLDLSGNKIENVDVFQKVNFPKLKSLFLYKNKISKIKKIDAIGFIEFKNLKFLTLGGNNISDIKELSQVDFKELEVLNLCDNSISDIEVLAKVNFPKLKKLNLANNLITNIEILKDVNFPELNELNLQQNKIVEINVFKKCKFKELSKLNIKLNKIDINKNLDIINELKYNLNLFI